MNSAKKLPLDGFDTRPSYRHLSFHLGIDLLLGGVIFVCLLEDWKFWLLAQLMVPVFAFRLFALMHDAVHGAVSKNRFLNHSLGIVAGAFCFLPYYSWRKIHLSHHLWAGNIDQDSTMKIVRDFVEEPYKKRRVLNFAWRSWLPLMALLQHVVFWSKAWSYFLERQALMDRCYMLASYVFPLLLYVVMKDQIFQVIPGILIYLVMVEVINFPHHLGLAQLRGLEKLSAKEQYLVSRSCSYPFVISYFVLNNFNYHTEHHIYPGLPWYKLHLIRSVVKHKLGTAYNESIGSDWILKNRKKTVQEVLASSVIKKAA